MLLYEATLFTTLGHKKAASYHKCPSVNTASKPQLVHKSLWQKNDLLRRHLFITL